MRTANRIISIADHLDRPLPREKFLAALAALVAGSTCPVLNIRSLRYYTAAGLMPHPLGSPKFARYTATHGTWYVAARALQDQGMKLEEIAVKLRGSTIAELELIAVAYLNGEAFNA